MDETQGYAAQLRAMVEHVRREGAEREAIEDYSLDRPESWRSESVPIVITTYLPTYKYSYIASTEKGLSLSIAVFSRLCEHSSSTRPTGVDPAPGRQLLR